MVLPVRLRIWQLQILPHLMTLSVKKLEKDYTILILVATSGDTGKAALEGFRDVPGTEILVFYPTDGVSRVQKLQMMTQEGENVSVCGIYGNFDDAQTGVKRIFADPSIRKKLEEKHKSFSSANSINFGRLLPQVVYYFSAYADLQQAGEHSAGRSYQRGSTYREFWKYFGCLLCQKDGAACSETDLCFQSVIICLRISFALVAMTATVLSIRLPPPLWIF